MVNKKYEDLAQEYKDFAYIISHDLSAPVRHIKAFSSMLVKTLGDDVTEQQAQYAGFIDTAISNLEKMNAALLAFSRVTTHARAHETTPARSFVDEAIIRLDVQSDKAVTLDIGDIPDLYGDQSQLGTVFFELLKNALTYHVDGAHKTISIAGSRSDDTVSVKITDNGIGIDPQHKGDVFDMFRRLHAREDYGGGAGAGLAIVQKIIHRHGGDITMDAVPGHSTTVTFTLPAAPQ